MSEHVPTSVPQVEVSSFPPGFQEPQEISHDAPLGTPPGVS